MSSVVDLPFERQVFDGVCPSCQRPLSVRPELIGRTPSSFEQCAFWCDDCGVAYSNATAATKRRRIVRNPLSNVPSEVRAGLREALDNAANETHRGSKRWAFCSDRSEDAVTWTVFRGLQAAGRLDSLERAAKPPPAAGARSLVLWGSACGGPDSDRIAADLEAVSSEIGESPRQRSEPDVIVGSTDVLIFVEAKLESPNDKTRTAGRFRPYLDRGDLFSSPPKAVSATGYYELVRNWVIGAVVAERSGRGFVLINLGPDTIASDSRRFAADIAQNEARRYAHVRWAELLRASGDLPDWLAAYAAAKNLRSI